MSISLRLRPEAETRLSNAVAKTGRPRNAIINDALIEYLHKFDSASVQNEIDNQLKLLNAADERDNFSDFGDWP
jgi:predicted DNA-binding protein